MEPQRRRVGRAAAVMASVYVGWFVSASVLAQNASSSATPSAIAGVLPAGAAVELVKDGFGTLDGPVAGPDGRFYFSDVGSGETYHIRQDGTIELFSESNNNATSLGFDPQGRLIVLEGITSRIVAVDRNKQATVLVEPQGGDRYSLNDVIVDTRGGIYFTDAASASQGGDTRASRVFYVRPGHAPVLLANTIGRPTGIVLSLDEKTLLIADSNAGALMAMDVQPDGMATNLRLWTQLQGLPQGRTGVPEGLAIDAEGRVYVATVAGVQVYSRTAEYLGAISVPRVPSNLAFGGTDRRTLYITARSALYRIRTLAAGPAGRAK